MTECDTKEICDWTPWCDDEEGGGKVTPIDSGEFELKENCKGVCENPMDIECEMSAEPYLNSSALGQNLTCDVDHGLVCNHSNTQPLCLDYRIR